VTVPESAVNLNGHMGLHNNWDVHAGGTYGGFGTTCCDRCTRGGPLLGQSPALYPWGGFNTDSRRAVSGGMWVNLGFWDEGRSTNSSFGPHLSLRLSTSLTFSLGGNLYRADDHTQWLANFTDALGTTHHAFAPLDQRTVSLNARVSRTATPDLALELYGEPFASSGTFSDVRELSATPGAVAYDARFRAYTPPAGTALSFSYRQLKTNTVLRWSTCPDRRSSWCGRTGEKPIRRTRPAAPGARTSGSCSTCPPTTRSW
jgi:hypothetical protein